MFLKYIISVVAFFLIMDTSFANKPENVDVLKEISGSTVYFRLTGVKVPIEYKKDGQMSGRVMGLLSLIPSGQPSKDTGRWWVKKDYLCQRWDNWLNKKVFCYSFQKKGNVVYWTRSDGQKGTALLGQR